ARREFLTAVHYEATRAGIDPQLMLAVMHVESAFRKYAISSAGARGLMQVMPFWTREIGDGDARKLFRLRANLRYGAVILRHYLDRENGDLNRALGRYNGSLGSAKYPNLVHSKLRKYWTWPGGK
ncbi:MAG: lytic transglycosylase domain-containing protein, partial [Gammaproteobacteria bacterium]